MDFEAEKRFAALLHHRTKTLAPGAPLEPEITSSETFHTPDVEGLIHF